MSIFEKVKSFAVRNQIFVVFGVSMVGIHMAWKEIQDKKYGIVRDPSDYPHRKVI